MQLGTRWPAGSEPPSRLPENLVRAIRDVEAGLETPTDDRFWTLTWLEGRPIVELDPANWESEPLVLTLDPSSGEVRHIEDDPDEDSEEY